MHDYSDYAFHSMQQLTESEHTGIVDQSSLLTDTANQDTCGRQSYTVLSKPSFTYIASYRLGLRTMLRQ